MSGYIKKVLTSYCRKNQTMWNKKSNLVFLYIKRVTVIEKMSFNIVPNENFS